MGTLLEELRDLLVVDDNPADARFIEEALQQSRLDPDVHHVTTCGEVREFLARRGPYEGVPRPDMVLLDWHLAKTTAEEVLTTLEREYPTVSVIVMTGTQPESQVADSAVAGADAVIEKPTEPEEYIDAIRSVMAVR